MNLRHAAGLNANRNVPNARTHMCEQRIYTHFGSAASVCFVAWGPGLSGPLRSETKGPAMRNEGLRYEAQRNLCETCVRNKAAQSMCMIACGQRIRRHRGHAVGEQAARESAIRKGLMRDRPAKLAMRNQKPAKLRTACGGSCET